MCCWNGRGLRNAEEEGEDSKLWNSLPDSVLNAETAIVAVFFTESETAEDASFQDAQMDHMSTTANMHHVCIQSKDKCLYL